MADLAPSSPHVLSTRPAVTAALMAETGLDHEILVALVHGFYAKVRDDELLGPMFAARISDWEPHLGKMVAFWSSVALMTGAYHGRPVPAHIGLPVHWTHFERWLSLFRETAHEICSPAGAEHVIERAERIAHSLHFAVQDARRAPGDVPSLR